MLFRSWPGYECSWIAVGTTVAGGPPHRSVREELHSYGFQADKQHADFLVDRDILSDVHR